MSTWLADLPKAQRVALAAAFFLTLGVALASLISADQAETARQQSEQALDSAAHGLAIARRNTLSIERLQETMRSEFERTNCIGTLTDETKQRIASNPAVLDRECPPVRR